MITDYSPIDTRQTFTLREAATYWAEQRVYTKDNSGEIEPYMSALKDAAERQELKVTFKYLQAWRPGGPTSSSAIDWASCMVSRDELVRWYKTMKPRPPFLFSEERMKQPQAAPSPSGRPTKIDYPTLDAILRGLLREPGGKLEARAIDAYQKETGRSVGKTTVKNRLHELRRSS